MLVLINFVYVVQTVINDLVYIHSFDQGVYICKRSYIERSFSANIAAFLTIYAYRNKLEYQVMLFNLDRKMQDTASPYLRILDLLKIN